MHINNYKILGIVPARGGSKGVKRKNIRMLSGKPLIQYSIESAQKSRYLTDFVVSTDDDEIKNVAESFGATVIKRTDELAQDDTPMLPVLEDALLRAEQDNGSRYDFIMILQPTAPLRTSSDIDSSIELIIANNGDSLTSLYRVEDCHPARMYTIENKEMKKIMPEPKDALRQALPDVFHRNGCIYISSRELIVKKKQIMSDSCIPFIMKEERSLNIDTELDLEFAEFIFQRERNALS